MRCLSPDGPLVTKHPSSTAAEELATQEIGTNTGPSLNLVKNAAKCSASICFHSKPIRRSCQFLALLGNPDGICRRGCPKERLKTLLCRLENVCHQDGLTLFVFVSRTGLQARPTPISWGICSAARFKYSQASPIRSCESIAVRA